MTPEQLAVERDWLLEHGRSVEEVVAMQWVVSRQAEAEVQARLREAAWDYGRREGMADYASDAVTGALKVIEGRQPGRLLSPTEKPETRTLQSPRVDGEP